MLWQESENTETHKAWLLFKKKKSWYFSPFDCTISKNILYSCTFGSTDSSLKNTYKEMKTYCKTVAIVFYYICA